MVFQIRLPQLYSIISRKLFLPLLKKVLNAQSSIAEVLSHFPPLNQIYFHYCFKAMLRILIVEILALTLLYLKVCTFVPLGHSCVSLIVKLAK